MPVKINMGEIMDKINANMFGTGNGGAKEVHDYCKVLNITEHRGQSGKLSLKVQMSTMDGKEFAGYLPATEKTTESTDKKVAWLGKEIGIDIIKIGNSVADDEDVNTPIEFTLAFGVKIGKKIEKSEKKPIVYIDREKDGEFWNTRITFGKKPEEEKKEYVPDEIEDSIFKD